MENEVFNPNRILTYSKSKRETGLQDLRATRYKPSDGPAKRPSLTNYTITFPPSVGALKRPTPGQLFFNR